MAKDADNNYYYDEGTIAEQFDNWEVYEDDDGNVGFYDGNGEVRIHEVALALGAPRTSHPDDTELADGESLVYVYDDEAGSIDLYAAYNDGGSIVTSSAASLVAP
jgi:hypothetical protein